MALPASNFWLCNRQSGFCTERVDFYPAPEIQDQSTHLGSDFKVWAGIGTNNSWNRAGFAEIR
jgi:hypothetical protein